MYTHAHKLRQSLRSIYIYISTWAFVEKNSRPLNINRNTNRTTIFCIFIIGSASIRTLSLLQLLSNSDQLVKIVPLWCYSNTRVDAVHAPVPYVFYQLIYEATPEGIRAFPLGSSGCLSRLRKHTDPSQWILDTLTDSVDLPYESANIQCLKYTPDWLLSLVMWNVQTLTDIAGKGHDVRNTWIVSTCGFFFPGSKTFCR